MYPQGVCRIRKPAYAGNGCAIFLVFQTEEVGQKDGCGSQTQLCACCHKLLEAGDKKERLPSKELWIL